MDWYVWAWHFDMAEVERDLVAMLSMFPAQEKPNDWVLPDLLIPKAVSERYFLMLMKDRLFLIICIMALMKQVYVIH